MAGSDIARLRAHLLAGQVIPAMPLALREDGSWSQRHQRALVRYYLEAGAGGLAVGVHSTQFEIRDPEHALFEPVLRFCAETIERELAPDRPFARIAGVCGETEQAVAEAEFAASVGYDAALVESERPGRRRRRRPGRPLPAGGGGASRDRLLPAAGHRGPELRAGLLARASPGSRTPWR